MIDRRHAIGAIAASATFAFAETSEACTSISQPKPRQFQLSKAKSEIRKLVRFANRAHSLSLPEIADWLDESRIDLSGVLDADHYAGWWNDEQFKVGSRRQYGLLKYWRQPYGTVDEDPIEIFDTNLIQSRKNYGVIQFSLRQRSYVAPYDEDLSSSCPSPGWPGGFVKKDRSYLAVTRNNKLDSVKHFPEWLLGSDK